MSDLIQLKPYDEHNQRLQSHVRPTDWTNPEPKGRYHLVVLGAGTAGLVTASIAAGLGAKVALVERELMGGDCLNVGCVPSKAIIAAARRVREVREAGEFGVLVPDGIEVDFAKVMERMRRLRADISPHDSVERFASMGVDVFLGEARFRDGETVEVGDQALRFRRAVIATGARAAAPAIPGLDQVSYLTNESVFSLTELPRRLGVIGAGPIGCELAQAFRLLGSEVFLVESEHGVLPREDRDAAAIVERTMLADGVQLLCCGRETSVRPGPGGIVQLTVESHGRQVDQEVDQLLVAVGRAANVDSLNLEKVGVEYDKKGLTVNDHLQTTNPRILAAGDVCSKYQFTHAADFMARLVVQNALFLPWGRVSKLVIPWCTYTSPEVAHVGLYEHEAEQREIAIDTYTQPLSGNDRAILEGDDEGFVKVHVRRGSDHILGATIVARDAGDLLSELTQAITHGLGLKKLGQAIHPYPTRADAVRRTGDLYNRSRLTPTIQSLMGKWFAWTG